MPKALIVDDEPDIRELLEMTLMRMDIDTHAAANIEQARTLLNSESFDVCLTDMRLPDGNGIGLVEYIQTLKHPLPVAVITAHGNIELAVQALKAGAFDFISKPVNLSALRDLVDTAIRSNTPATTQPHMPSKNPQDQLVGQSKAMQTLKATITKLARSQAPVWIRGESGTGKELVAKIIHQQGPRQNGPFIPVNCGAIPSELMESEFFGHRKGSFTGATHDNPGLFQSADGGTLFLDEVADLPLSMQVKLLRAIQEKAVRPVGESNEIPVNVRILSASHKDLTAEVATERFRQDLYYRLNVIELRVPSLRERRSDIPILITALLRRMISNSNEDIPTLSDQALTLLNQHDFPGNVRELENRLERALALYENDRISAEDLGFQQATDESKNTIASPDTTLEKTHLASTSLAEHERTVLLSALEKTRWNKKSAAELLNISYRQLRYKVSKLGL